MKELHGKPYIMLSIFGNNRLLSEHQVYKFYKIFLSVLSNLNLLRNHEVENRDFIDEIYYFIDKFSHD